MIRLEALEVNQNELKTTINNCVVYIIRCSRYIYSRQVFKSVVYLLDWGVVVAIAVCDPVP